MICRISCSTVWIWNDANGDVAFPQITYTSADMENAVKDPTTGKDYWGNMHAVQIYHFYEALAGNEPLELSAREALKIQKIICEIYKEPHSKLKG